MLSISLVAEPIALKLKSSSTNNLSPKSVQILAGSMFLVGTLILMLLRQYQVIKASEIHQDLTHVLSNTKDRSRLSYYRKLRRMIQTMFAIGNF